jgi:hypothetical protein
MEEFPGNSRRPVVGPISNAELPPEGVRKLSPVPGLNKEDVIRKKKPLGQRIRDTFFAKDSANVITYLLKDVLVPALQDLVTDMVKQGIERAVYGEVQSPRRTRGSAQRTHVSYNQPSVIRPAQTSFVGRRPAAQTSSVDIGQIVVPDMVQAQLIAEQLFETVEQYGTASVANLYELLNQTAVVTDHKWGWHDLSTMEVKRVREGYWVVLPDPESIR